VQSSEGPNDASFVRVSLFANGFEIGSAAPIEGYLDELLLDAVDIVVLCDEIATYSMLILHSLKIKKTAFARTMSSSSFCLNLGILVLRRSVLDFS
jgi:hypothetical protein